MVNYKNGKIYKIESQLGDLIYIGSTTKEYLSQRMDSHRGDYKKWKKNNLKFITSYTIFEEYGLENCNIILLESVPCDSKDELVAREAYHIRNLNCVNKVIPGRTLQEYQETNKEMLRERKEMLKDETREKAKLYYEANKEKAKLYYEANKEKAKEYREIYRQENREQILEKKRLYNLANKDKRQLYYEANKDKILLQRQMNRKQK